MSVKYLFGCKLMVENYTNICANSHVFYCPVHNPSTKINICIWSVTISPKREVNFFSAYDDGKQINPRTDPRFSNAASKHFPENKPWAECAFNNMDELLSFLKNCNI